MIFTVRQMQEKCIEFQVFFHLTKAFDAVNQNVLWKILDKFGCAPNFAGLLCELQDNMNTYVNCNGCLSKPIAVDSDIKQGDIPAPTLFSVFFAVTLSLAFNNCDNI